STPPCTAAFGSSTGLVAVVECGKSLSSLALSIPERSTHSGDSAPRTIGPIHSASAAQRQPQGSSENLVAASFQTARASVSRLSISSATPSAKRLSAAGLASACNVSSALVG